VIKAAPHLIAALKQAYRATESKLEEASTPESYEAVNDRMMSQSDPDAACVRQGRGQSRPRYKHHRAIDDRKGVITALETTPGSIAENKKLMGLVDQHEKNTNCQAQIVIADHKYGTTENFVQCQARGITTHMGDAGIKAHSRDHHTIFGDEAFAYDRIANIYRCPAGQVLRPRRMHPIRRTIEYKAPARVCAGCLLRPQCTRSSHGRTVQRHEKQAALDVARAQAHSLAARLDRKAVGLREGKKGPYLNIQQLARAAQLSITGHGLVQASNSLSHCRTIDSSEQCNVPICRRLTPRCRNTHMATLCACDPYLRSPTSLSTATR